MEKSFKEKYEKVCSIKDKALCLVMDQINGDLSLVDAKELGEVADIAKDMSELMKYCAEAEYYHKVVEAMEESSDEEKSYYLNKYIPEYNGKFYTPMYHIWDDRYEKDRMYYSEPKGMHYSIDEHNMNDGKAWESRRSYMEIKDYGDKTIKSQELERYIKDLGEDLSEMIMGMDQNDKMQLKNKIIQLSNKIV